MNKFLSILILSGIGFAYAGKDCNYSLSLNNSTVQITDIDQVVQRDFTVNYTKNNGNRDCSMYRVYFGKGLANSYQRKAYSVNSKSVNYNLHRQVNMSGVLKDIGDALNANEYIEGSAPSANTNYQNSFFVSVPNIATQNYPKSGSYTDNLQVTIYGYVDEKRDFVFEQAANLTLLFMLNNKISLSLVDEGGAFDENATAKVLDFGFLTQSQEKAVDLRVVSNTPYQIKASSNYGGNLKHTSQSSQISYSMKVNGTGVSLSSSAGNPVTLGIGQETTSSGDKYNLRFQILSNTSNMPAGLYQDQITITAIAN